MKTPLVKQFGKRVRELRLAAGMSQESLANECGCARPYMSNIERGQGNPSLGFIGLVAAALKVEAKALFEVTGAVLPKAKIKLKAKPTVIEVPFNKDGTCFNPALRRPSDRKYTVGEDSEEVYFDDFNAALKYLKAMKKAYWRRPNKEGDWGRVVAARWGPLPREYSMP